MTTIVTDDLVEYLRSKSLQPKQKTSTEVTIHCLDCEAGHEKKLGKLYINTETWLAFCQRCQATYNKRTLLRHFGDEVDETPEVRANEHKLEIYAQYVDLAHQHLLGNEKMLRYLIERGLDETTIIDARLGYSPKGVSLTRSLPGLDGDGWTIAQLQASGLLDGRGRDFFSQCITIPYLSRNQVLQVRGRDMAGGRGGRYLTMSGDRARIFGQDDLVQDKVTVVEGEFDCLMLRQTLRLSSNPEHRQMGVIAFPGVAVWPGGNDNIAETLDGPSRVYIGFDPDEVGRREAAKLREALGTKSRVIKLPVDDTDWSDWLKSGENDVDDVWRLVTRAEMEGKRIFTPSETREAFLEMNEAGGIKLGWPSLDALIAPGPRPGNVIIPIAGTGCGKTSFLANIAWNLRDRRVLHITMENTAAEFYDVIRRIQSFHLPHSRESSVQEHLPYLRICQENRLRIADLDLLIAEYEEEVGAKPEVIQIDYLGYLANGFPGGSDYERVSAASFLLKELAKKHNLIVICPSQISRKAEAGKPLTIADAKDSSKIEDTADFAFGLFRPSEAAEKRLVGSASYHPEFTMQLLKSRRGNAGKWVQLMSAPKTLAMVDAKDQKAVSRVQTEVQAHNQGAALESIQSLHRRATEIQTVSDLGVAARRVSR